SVADQCSAARINRSIVYDRLCPSFYGSVNCSCFVYVRCFFMRSCATMRSHDRHPFDRRLMLKGWLCVLPQVGPLRFVLRGCAHYNTILHSHSSFLRLLTIRETS